MARSWVLGLLLASLGTLAGQHGEKRSPVSQLVDLNIVALDAKGEPVRDLQSGDFQIYDDGKLQSIVYFRHFEAAPSRRAPPGPGEYSNQAANAGHPTVILFDQLNQVMGDRGYTQTQLVRSLEPMENSDDLYLYLLTVDGHLYPVRPLPTAAERQTAQVPWTRQIRPMLDQALRAVLRGRPIDVDIFARIDLTYRALEDLARRLEAIPGRKNLVWLSHGVPITLSGARTYDGEPVDYTPALRLLSDTLDRAHVSIYPVQLSPPGMMTESSTNSPSLTVQQGGRGGRTLTDPGGSGNPAGVNEGSGVGSEDTLLEFAGLTGGRAHGSNDVGQAIRQAMHDARSSYQVGYYTPPQSWDGKHHKLRLVCTRKGVRLQGKTGYYAWAQPDPTEEKDVFAEAAVGKFDNSEIGVRAAVTPGGAGSKAGHVRVVIDARDVLFALDQNRYTAHLSVQYAAYLSDGRVTGLPAREMEISQSPEEHDKALKNGLEASGDLPAGAGLEKVRFMVYDRATHAIGSLTIPIGQ